MIARILFAAILAGIAAGVFTTAVQAYKVAPLILEAETYEGGAHDHAAHDDASSSDAGEAVEEAHDDAAGDGHAHSHGEGVWAPGDGLERTAFTLLTNVLTGVAFGFLLIAAVVFTGREISLKHGILWGIGGFAAFSLAPSLGLPPELPGMPAGDLVARQVWWWSTVVLTCGGLACLVLTKQVVWKVLGLVLLIAPHVIGAPHPEIVASNVPAILAAEFASATLAMAALFWVVLGGSAGWFLQRFAADEGV